MVSGERRPELTRILLVNANTSASITAKLVAAAAAQAPSVAWLGATGRFGASYIASRSAAAIAGHAALDALAAAPPGHAGVLLGCFGDPGLDALKEIAGVPVRGLGEASASVALRAAARFSVVTGGAAWGPMLREFYAARGLGDRLASVRTVAPTGAEIAAAPAAALALLAAEARAAAAEDGAGAVVLGGAGLAGLAPAVAARAGVPVLCSLACGVAEILAAIAAPAVAAVTEQATLGGLSPELQAFLTVPPAA
jgi:Asp/Glu/hydantoin racemase